MFNMKMTESGLLSIAKALLWRLYPSPPYYFDTDNSTSSAVRTNTSTMWILPLIGYIGLVIGFAFLTLAIASGLYYLSELVEEYTVLSKKLLYRMIYGIIAFQSLLMIIDGLPKLLSLLSIGSHVVYMQNLRRFPIVKLNDPIFILSCILVLVNHWVWFRHFSKPPTFSPPPGSYRRLASYDSPYFNQPSFTEIASFFGLCVWLVPFSLFVSLSASENVLPSMGSEYATGEGSSYVKAGKEPSMNGTTGGGKAAPRAGLVKVAVDSVRGWVGDAADLMGYRRSDRNRYQF